MAKAGEVEVVVACLRHNARAEQFRLDPGLLLVSNIKNPFLHKKLWPIAHFLLPKGDIPEAKALRGF